MLKPIFIFSLPRSGSTLLQRILTTSDAVSSAAEPWVLLPFIYTMRPEGVISEYWHESAVQAIKDFYEGSVKGKRGYTNELSQFALRLYQLRTEESAGYFIDKTPRYHLICNEIMDLFPDGKFIFMWRNPLAIVSSIIESWYQGKWKIAIYYIDLFKGLNSLLTTYLSRNLPVYAIKYENLILNARGELRQLCDYIGIAYNEDMLVSFSNVQLKGSMGDKTGTRKYNTLTKKSLDAWPESFNNPYRRYWARKYLDWIGVDHLALMGYDYCEFKRLLYKKNTCNFNVMLSDFAFSLLLYCKMKISPLSISKGQNLFFK